MEIIEEGQRSTTKHHTNIQINTIHSKFDAIDSN